EKGQVVVKGGKLQYIDCTVRVWEPDGSAEPLKLGVQLPVYATAFAPDGAELISGGADLTLRYWEPAAGRSLRDEPLKGYLYGVAYSPDGRLLASVTADH